MYSTRSLWTDAHGSRSSPTFKGLWHLFVRVVDGSRLAPFSIIRLHHRGSRWFVKSRFPWLLIASEQVLLINLGRRSMRVSLACVIRWVITRTVREDIKQALCWLLIEAPCDLRFLPISACFKLMSLHLPSSIVGHHEFASASFHISNN